MALIKDLATVNAEIQEQKERGDLDDFKVVTFSLADKDYGVDIMNVKEIAKADKFTFVPNAASYVRGVYNLRGDIIPIIDLRTFFHIPVDTKENVLENMLILRLEERVYGTIVDRIDKVVSINSNTIQPPHPIFGDINIKYISGVVEKEGDLYIILDVIRIFSQNTEATQTRSVIQGDTGTYTPPPVAEIVPEERTQPTDSSLNFIRDGLRALSGFTAGPINEAWIRRRFSEWSDVHTGSEVQLRNLNDADEFLSAFYAPCTGMFWTEDYALALKSMLPELSGNNLQVWNLGCGKGYETYSLACILKSRYPGRNIKIWANDNDIMSISQAPNLVFDLQQVPEYARPYTVKGSNGYSFSQEIKDAILFEFHDVLNGNNVPDVDIILARDLLSFFPLADQDRLIQEFAEKLKGQGIVFLGRNEQLPVDTWQPLTKDPISAFARN